MRIAANDRRKLHRCGFYVCPDEQFEYSMQSKLNRILKLCTVFTFSARINKQGAVLRHNLRIRIETFRFEISH